MAAVEFPVIDLSIVTFNSSRWIDGFFESLEHQDYPLENINVYVTDNGSTDDTLAKLGAVSVLFRCRSFQIVESVNHGFGHGHNSNIRKGTADFVLAANIDLSFERTSISEIVSYACLDDATTASWEMRQKPHEHPKYYHPVTLETSWSSSACILLRRQALEAVGGYDEMFFMYCEDVDLSWRLRAKGYRLKYCPSATCWHHTYAESRFKKIQFLGSLVGNLYLRNRFGSLADVENGESNYRAIMENAELHYPEQREDLVRHFNDYLTKKNHFLAVDEFTKDRYASVARFQSDWDYELVRDGAFHELVELPDNPPLVSIVVRTFEGRDRLLRAALKSVANQTYRNFEVIVVEDGGSSTTPVVASLADPRFRHIACQKAGRCHSGNAGLSAARGEFIGFLDDDDLFFADHLEVNVSALLLGNPGRARVAYSSSFEVKSSIDRDAGGFFYVQTEVENPAIYDHRFSLNGLLWQNILPIQAAIFHRSLYDELGGFDTDLENLEDWNLWTRFACASPFVRVGKTTSLFRTPADGEAASARDHFMRQYYETAVRKQSHMKVSHLTAADLREDFRFYRDELIAREDEIGRLSSQLHAATSEMAQHKRATDDLRKSLLALQKEHDIVVNSRSMRLTAPIRRTIHVLKAALGFRGS